MNAVIKQIRDILTSYASEYQAGMEQMQRNTKRFNPDVAKPENDKIQAGLDASVKKGKEDIAQLCQKGLEASLKRTHLHGSDIPADAQLLKEGIVTHVDFAELVERYRGVYYNYTMLTILREYARMNKLPFPSSIPTRTDMIDGWKHVEDGAVFTIGSIHGTGLTNNDYLRAMSIAEGFMANPVSDLLTEVIGD